MLAIPATLRARFDIRWAGLLLLPLPKKQYHDVGPTSVRAPQEQDNPFGGTQAIASEHKILKHQVHYGLIVAFPAPTCRPRPLETAGCAVVEPEGAFFIGLVSATNYLAFSRFLELVRIDDMVCTQNRRQVGHAYATCYGDTYAATILPAYDQPAGLHTTL